MRPDYLTIISFLSSLMTLINSPLMSLYLRKNTELGISFIVCVDMDVGVNLLIEKYHCLRTEMFVIQKGYVANAFAKLMAI